MLVSDKVLQLLSAQRMYQLVLIVYGLTLVTAESLGPPPGSRGTIDFRYPNYIVKPLPSCPSEGVYPHPANCSWYYRCYTYITRGQKFYRRSYFECEPGTQFSDELDQCVFPHSGSSCSPTPTCEDVTDQCSFHKVCYQDGVPEYRNLCKDAYIKCPSAGHLMPKCSNDQFYDIERKQCVPDPATTKCRPTCNPTQSGCNSVRVCTAADGIIQKTLCTSATTCDSEGRLVGRCQHRQLFDPESLTCVIPYECSNDQLMSECANYEVCDSSNRKSKEYLCRVAYRYKSSSDYTLVEICPPKMYYSVLEERCVSNPELRSCPKCIDRYNDCNYREVCANGRPVQTYLCGEVHKCDFNGQSYRLCNLGSYYDKSKGLCLGTLESLKCPLCEESYKGCKFFDVCYSPGQKQNQYICREASKCVNNKPIPRCRPDQYYDLSNKNCISHPDSYKCSTVTNLVETNQVTCSTVNSYPFEDWMKTTCWRVNLCQEGRATLCKKFYRCEFQNDGTLFAREYSCNKGFTFSYKTLQCIPQPEDSQICGVEFDYRKRL